MAKTAVKAKTAKKKAKTEATKSNRQPKTGDAIELLKADHRTVEDLYEVFEASTDSKKKQRIAKEICMELIVHTQIEEEIFYPAVKDVVEDDMYAEAHVEHDGAKVLIAEILNGDPDSEFYNANVKVLSEMIKHHVKEEEQRDGLFAQAKRGDLDMEALGAKLMQRKRDLTDLYKRSGLPRPTTRTMTKMPKLELGRPVS
jgi:hemerythrin superfamily protein